MPDLMKPIVTALRDLAKAIQGTNTAGNSLQDQFGWNFPDLNSLGIAKQATLLADRLLEIPGAKLNPEYDFDAIKSKIDKLKSQVVPQLWNGNGHQAYPIYSLTLQWIDDQFKAVYPVAPDWEAVDQQKLMPKSLSGRLRGLNNSINKLSADREELEEKVAYIEQAHEAAVALPTDLESLREATKEVEEFRSEAEKSKVLADAAREAIVDVRDAIQVSRDDAVKLVENIEDAYSAATTKGLGQAFQERAGTLSMSMWVWVAGLMTALALGAWAGSHRVGVLETLLIRNASADVIWLNMLLAFFTVAAPVWFAWIATKQIGHRFRLSEDYAFKASVARAYEGYRREAARLDPAFARKLFDSALNRLDEAPIRFVEQETFGSPWHEAFRLRRRQKAALVEQPTSTSVTAPLRPSTEEEDEN